MAKKKTVRKSASKDDAQVQLVRADVNRELVADATFVSLRARDTKLDRQVALKCRQPIRKRDRHFATIQREVTIMKRWAFVAVLSCTLPAFAGQQQPGRQPREPVSPAAARSPVTAERLVNAEAEPHNWLM